MDVCIPPVELTSVLTHVDSFILEGILTVIVASVAYKVMVDEPSTAKFLSDHEKHLLLNALNDTCTHSGAAPATEAEKYLKWKHVVAALTDWQVN